LCVTLAANTIGYLLAANLSQTLDAVILLLTPLAFLFSTARNAKELSDVAALLLGLLLYPLFARLNSGVDVLLSGVVAGTLAYGIHRARARA
jgi:Na+/H+ antiporter NhaA